MIVFCVVLGLMIAVFLYGSKWFIAQPNVEYLSKANTNSIKAVCACGVMLNHIANEVDLGPFMSVFRMVGFLMVAVFFFFSGYGLIVSLNTKPNYAKTFVTKRLPNFLVPYLLALTIFCIYHVVAYGAVPFRSIVMQFIGEVPVVRNSWFVIVLLYLYILFWTCFRWIRSRLVAKVLFYLGTITYSVVMIFPFWNPAIIGFLFGALCADYKEYFDKLFIRKGWFTLLGGLCIFGALIVVRIGKTGLVEAILGMACSIAFIVLIMAILTKVQPRNKVLSFLNKISFEIYLYHGFIMCIFGHIPYIVSRPILYLVLTISLSVILAYLMWLMGSFIIKKLCSLKYEK